MRNLSAYIPTDRRQALVRGEALPDRCVGAALFADVSGFTPLTRAFAEELGAKHGAEALLGVLNPLFATLIAPVHRYGGSVIGFVGDAITCWFGDFPPSIPPTGGKERGGAAARAVAAALAMQAALGPLSVARTPGGVAVTLSIKVAVAYGPARRFVVGDPAIQQMDALAGTTLARMAEAEHHAEANEVVVSQEVVTQVGAGLVVSEWRGDGRFAVVTGLPRPIAPTPEMTAAAELSEDKARSWVLPAVYVRLREGADFLGDLRPATPLMLRFGGLDYDGDDAVGEKLDVFVRWVQHIVHRYTGNLLQLTIGDKGAFMYAVFGAPVTHEDDAARALRAALALRVLPPELSATITSLQIGLTRGEVWTGICGAVARHVYNAVSSEVNLAARLMAKAQPGQVLVSGQMAQTPGFTVAYLGDWAYKGFDAPLPTYELQGEQLAEICVFPNVMVGRDVELQRLVDFAQPLFEGKLAGAAIIYGEPGIGKSRLSYALRQTLGAAVTWFTGQADQILQQPLNPFVYWLQRYFDQSPQTSTAENQARFEARLKQLYIDLSGFENLTGLREELSRTHSFLGALLNLHWAGSLYEQLDDSKLRHENTLTALKTLLLAESCLQPVVFELEDGHWVDAASRELLLALSRNVVGYFRMAQYPLLIVITSRYADDGSRLNFALNTAMPTLILDLNVLSLSALEQQAKELLGGAVDPELLALLWERGRANPFFTEQTLFYLRENDLLALTPDQTWSLATSIQPSASNMQLPDSLNTMLIARIDRLTQQVKEVVQAAAVLGREFDVQLLSQMLAAQDVPGSVQQAEHEQIWALLSELRYIFKHALLRDAAYEMQLRARLRELHRLAAEALEKLYAADLIPHYGALAYHYTTAYRQGLSETRDKVCHYLRLAGETAQAAYANAAALDYYGQLLPLLTDPREQMDIHFKRGAVLELIGKYAEAEHDYRAALTLAGADAAARAQALINAGQAVMLQGDYANAEHCFRQALDQAEEASASLQQARALGGLGSVAYQRGDYPDALSHHEQALTLHRAIHDRRGQAQSLKNLGQVTTAQGTYASASYYYQEALKLIREMGHRQDEGLLFKEFSTLAVLQGEYQRASADLQQSLTLAQATGDRRTQADALRNLGSVAWSQGQYGQAANYYEQSLAIIREIGDRRGESSSLNNLGVTAWSLGQYEHARRYYEQSLTIMQELGDRVGQPTSLINLGLMAWSLGQYEHAYRYYEQSLALSREIGDRSSEDYALTGLGDAAWSQGQYEQARRYYEQSLAISQEIGDRAGEGYALTGLGNARIGLGEFTDVAACLQSAISVRQELAHPALLMESRVALAHLALAQHQPEHALAILTDVLTHLAQGGNFDGTEYGLHNYLICYRVLHANHDPRAVAILHTAYEQLQTLAGKFESAANRRIFLENIPWHREIIAAWQQHHEEKE